MPCNWYIICIESKETNKETDMSAKMRMSFGPKTAVVGFDELSKPQMPAKTDSYVPLRHDEFVKMVTGRLQENGMGIVNEVHALWRGGQRYFGLMEVSHPSIASSEMSLVVGLRNSYDKSLPAAIAAGNSVFVCDNLCLSAEIVVGRKHTKNIMEDIFGRIQNAMLVLQAHWNDHFNRVQAYKNRELSAMEAHDVIVEAYRKGAISKVGMSDVVDQWYTPNHNEFKDRNVWSMHNAFTEVWKGRADLLADRSDALHAMFDNVVGFSATEAKRVFAEIEASESAAGKGARSRGLAVAV